MKFGILTFHSALNIGAQLQAFALYSKLKSLGYTIEFINYTPKYLKTPYTFFRNSHLKNGIFSVIKQGILHLYFDTFTWIRTQIHYKKFRHKYFVISKETYKTPQELAQSEYDGFIVGSDQIWSPEITNKKIDEMYTLHFNNSNKLKIAYAASFSEKHITPQQTNTLISRIKDFNHLSVREENLAIFLKKQSNLQIDVVLDPTLLLNKQEWLKYIPSKPLVKKPYILIYQARGPQSALLSQVSPLAKKINAQIINASGMNYRIKHNGMQYVNPLEFLNLVLYAELIVTVSFHGTALSIILEKSFYSINLNDGRDSRVISLLKAVNLENRLKSINDTLELQNIDYTNITNKLNELRNKSIKYLKKSLN